MTMEYPKRIFLIDDDDDDHEFLSLGLSHLSKPIELHYESSCDLALHKLADPNLTLPDLIFLDWNMPKISGEQCLKEIRSIDRCAKIPIIVFTTSSSEKDNATAMLNGATRFITKPSSLKDLTNQLQSIFMSLGKLNWQVK